MRRNFFMDHNTMNGATGLTLGGVSGAVTVVAAGGDLFAVRNIAERSFQVSAIRIRWVTTTAFGAAQGLAFRMHKVTGFSSIHSGGTPTAVRAHYRNQAGVQGTATGDRVALTDISAVIAGVAAITTATYTAADDEEPEIFAVGAGSVLPGVYEDWTPQDRLPLVLGAETGLVLKNHITMGATGVGNLFVGIDGFWMQ